MGNILGGAIGGAGITYVIKAIDEYSKEFKKVDEGLKQQKTGFDKLGDVLSKNKLLVGAAAGAMVAFGADSVKSALKSERAFQQFNLALGDSADTMLKDMRNASQGMISDFDLVNDANKALALGISQNQIPELLEVATARSKVFGRTASEAFNDLAIGIGRQSRMILDNLGIILDLDKTYSEFAITIGKTTDELTDLEKKQALVNSIIEDSQGLIRAQMFLEETHAEKIEKVVAQYDNLKVAIGEVLIATLDYISGATAEKTQREEMFNLMTGMPGVYEEIGEVILQLSDKQKEYTEQLKVSNDNVKNLIDSLLNLKDITFEGERTKKLEISQQKEIVRQLELKKLEEKNIIPAKKEYVSLIESETDLQKELFAQQKITDDLTIKYLSTEKDGRDEIGAQLNSEKDKLKILSIKRNEEKKQLEEINIAKREEFEQSQTESTKTLDNIQNELDKAKNKLEILRLEQEKNANEKEIQQNKNAIQLETLGELEVTNFNNFITDQQKKFESLATERQEQENIRLKIGEVQDKQKELLDKFVGNQEVKSKLNEEEQNDLQDIIKLTDDLIARYNTAINKRNELEKKEVAKSVAKTVISSPSTLLNIATGNTVGLISSIVNTAAKLLPKSIVEPSTSIFTGLQQSMKVDDAIITKRGDVIKTNPMDTLIATQHPENLSSNGITININNLNGFNARDIANQLQSELNKKV